MGNRGAPRKWDKARVIHILAPQWFPELIERLGYESIADLIYEKILEDMAARGMSDPKIDEQEKLRAGRERRKKIKEETEMNKQQMKEQEIEEEWKALKAYYEKLPNYKKYRLWRAAEKEIRIGDTSLQKAIEGARDDIIDATGGIHTGIQVRDGVFARLRLLPEPPRQ